MKNAFVRDESGQHIDPALVKLSSGDLPLPENLAVALTESGDLKFTWIPNPILWEGADVDQIMMVAYDVENGVADYTTTGQFRSTGEDILNLDRNRFKKVHVYAAFNAQTAAGNLIVFI